MAREDRAESGRVIRHVRRWQSEPMTVWRVGEAMARMLVAGVLGVGASVLLARFIDEQVFLLMGYLLPFYVVLDWVMPDA